MIYDTLVIGGGPAGMNAALYLKRGGLSVIIIEKMFNGGQMVNTFEIDNYLGTPSIDGPELSMKMLDHIKQLGIETVMDEVISIDTSNRPFKIQTKKGKYIAKTIIIATGAVPRKLNVPGEEKFLGRGVSYCATCDGAFYKDKEVVVLGSGNTAIEDAIFLARTSSKVTLISRSGIFKGDKRSIEFLKTNKKVELLNNFSTVEVIGDDKLEQIKLVHVENKEELIIDVDGIFVGIGTVPGCRLLHGIIKRNEEGYIITDDYMNTNVNGIFAAGDIRETPLRQIATSLGDGAIAAIYAAKNISQMIIRHAEN